MTLIPLKESYGLSDQDHSINWTGVLNSIDIKNVLRISNLKKYNSQTVFSPKLLNDELKRVYSLFNFVPEVTIKYKNDYSRIDFFDVRNGLIIENQFDGIEAVNYNIIRSDRWYKKNVIIEPKETNKGFRINGLILVALSSQLKTTDSKTNYQKISNWIHDLKEEYSITIPIQLVGITCQQQ